jgi:hypothetical protein
MSASDGLKKEARQLELRVEAKLNEFSRAHELAADPEAATDERAAIKEIEDYLQQLTDTTERLAAEVAEHPSRADTAMVKVSREVNPSPSWRAKDLMPAHELHRIFHCVSAVSTCSDSVRSSMTSRPLSESSWQASAPRGRRQRYTGTCVRPRTLPTPAGTLLRQIRC